MNNEAQVHRLAVDVRGAVHDLEREAPQLMADMAHNVANRVRAVVPVLTGRMKNSVFSSMLGEFGYDGSAVYAGWVDFGGSTGVPGSGRRVYRTFYHEGRYLFPSLSREAAHNYQLADKMLDVVFSENGL